MAKKYVIMSNEVMKFTYADGHERVSGGAQVDFIFSSLAKAQKQMDMIHQLIKEKKWWSEVPGKEDNHVIKADENVSGSDIIRRILVTRDEDEVTPRAYHLNVGTVYSLWVREENSGYGIN